MKKKPLFLILLSVLALSFAAVCLAASPDDGITNDSMGGGTASFPNTPVDLDKLPKHNSGPAVPGVRNTGIQNDRISSPSPDWKDQPVNLDGQPRHNTGPAVKGERNTGIENDRMSPPSPDWDAK